MGGVSEHAYELSAADEGPLSRLAAEAAGGDVVYLTRAGQRIAAVVPAEVAAAGAAAIEAAIEALEDAEDIAAADAAIAEYEAGGGLTHSLDEVLTEPTS